MTTSFALPGTLAPAEIATGVKFQQLACSKDPSCRMGPGSSTSALPTQSLTTITYGMPTPQMPLNLLDMGQTMESEAYVEKPNS